MRSILLAALLSALFVNAASALQVRFYPGDHLYSYEAAAGRDAHTLMIHNVAVLNDGATPVTISSLTIELMQGDRVIDARTLGAPELTRAAGNGAQFTPEFWRLLAFQFGGDRLLPAGTHFASSTTLAPGDALLFGAQMFAYRGARDSVRVRVNDNAATGRLTIRNTVSTTRFQFPLQGMWYAGSGPGFSSGHRWSPMEEFGFDLLQVDAQGKTHRGDGTHFTDYYAYGQPVFAAAAGRVVLVITDQREDTHAMQQPGETVDAYNARLQQDQMARVAQGVPGVLGNGVVIDHGHGEFSAYAHLKPGSVRVRVGENVTQGQRIGDLGSSGNSTEPHLHFQVCDGPDPLMCAGIPMNLDLAGDSLGNPSHATQPGDFMSRAN